MSITNMDDSINKAFLGTGWAFPPSFGNLEDGVEMISEEDDIKQSLFLLISTIPGERIMRPNYGCDLHSLVFERLNANTRTQIRKMIEMAILYFEPRITLTDIAVKMNAEDVGVIFINIGYFVRKTNSRGNIVYPFYLKEGTLVRNA